MAVTTEIMPSSGSAPSARRPLLDRAERSHFFAHLRAHAQQLLADAGYPAAAAALDPALLASALDAVQAHLEKEGDLRSHAIAQGLLVT